MNESSAFLQPTVEDEMQVRVHQGESQDDDIKVENGVENPVHPLSEVLLIAEHSVNAVPVSVEMPAIPDWLVNAFSENLSQSDVLFQPPDPFLTVNHISPLI